MLVSFILFFNTGTNIYSNKNKVIISSILPKGKKKNDSSGGPSEDKQDENPNLNNASPSGPSGNNSPQNPNVNPELEFFIAEFNPHGDDETQRHSEAGDANNRVEAWVEWLTYLEESKAQAEAGQFDTGNNEESSTTDTGNNEESSTTDTGNSSNNSQTQDVDNNIQDNQESSAKRPRSSNEDSDLPASKRSR